MAPWNSGGTICAVGLEMGKVQVFEPKARTRCKQIQDQKNDRRAICMDSSYPVCFRVKGVRGVRMK